MEEYRTYYATRARRYEGKANWQNSYNAEKKLCDFMCSLDNFDGEETKNEVVKLSFECAKGVNKDQFLMEEKHFHKHQEVVREAGARRISQLVDNQTNINDMSAMIQEETNRNDLEVTADEAQRDSFQNCIRYLLRYERELMWEGPSEYKKSPETLKQELKQKIFDELAHVRTSVQKFVPDWTFDPEKNLEPRHLHKLSYFKDEDVQAFFKLFKEIINK